MKVIGFRWKFKLKVYSRGNIIKCKARLVVRDDPKDPD